MLCGSGKTEILSSCTKLVCCLARSLRQQQVNTHSTVINVKNIVINVNNLCGGERGEAFYPLKIFNRGYFAYDFAVSGIVSIHTNFWQVHLFEFQYKCITEKWFLPFYKRPRQKYNFICCLKYTWQFFSIYFCEAKQSGGKIS